MTRRQVSPFCRACRDGRCAQRRRSHCLSVTCPCDDKTSPQFRNVPRPARLREVS